MQKNFYDKLRGIKSQIRLWSWRGLSLFDKVPKKSQLLRVLLLPKVLYVSSILPSSLETSRHMCTRINEHLNMDKASHIFKHLQDSPRCRTFCSSECFVVIDQVTTRTKLKIKEAVHIQWEKPSLYQQLFHVNLCNQLLYHTIVILIFRYILFIFVIPSLNWRWHRSCRNMSLFKFKSLVLFIKTKNTI